MHPSWLNYVAQKPGVLKIAFIPNAMGRNISDKEKQYFTQAGHHPVVIDLKNYTTNTTLLRNHLQKADLIWARGGDPGQLARIMDAVSYKEASNNIAYIGVSAGAMVAGQGLNAFNMSLNQPDPIGLKLTQRAILPHVNPGHKLTRAGMLVKHLWEGKQNILTLNDTQALLLENNMEKIVTTTQPTNTL